MTSDETGKRKRKFRKLGTEPFDETEHGLQTVNVVEAEDGAKLVGIRKLFKKKEEDGSIKTLPRRGKSFFIPLPKLQRLVDALRSLAIKFGWKPVETEAEKKIGELNAKIVEMEAGIARLHADLESMVEEKAEYEIQVKQLTEKLVKSNLGTFRKDVHDLKGKLDDAVAGRVREEEIQQFLKDRPWLFGVEFIRSEPKKPAGSKSIFDFYLLDFLKHGIVVELKLPSDKILVDEYVLSQKVTEAIGQLIRYLETTTAISSSTDMSKIEKVEEKKPTGYLIIGRTTPKEDTEQLHRINSYLHAIQIQTYDDLIAKAETALATFSPE